MDRNAYQSELDWVQFTEAGKSALTDALMAEQAGPAVRRRSFWMKWGTAAVLAAVLLVGTAAAVTASLWDRYFGGLDPAEQAVVDTLSGDLPGAVSSNGAVMTPQAAFGTDGVFYLMLEVEAPEGTVLPTQGEDWLYSLSSFDDPKNWACLETAEGRRVENLTYSLDLTCLEDSDPTDNKITVVVEVLADGDLTGLTVHIPGLWMWATDGTYTPLFTGEFTFPISEGMGEESVMTLDVAGVTTETPWGSVVLETLELSPLGARWSYRIPPDTAQAAREEEQAAWEEPPAVVGVDEDGDTTAMEVKITPGAPLSAVLRDGTEVSVNDSFSGEEDGLQVCSGTFGIPLDLAQVSYLLWGGTEIPLL